jgi:hypothetical protein
MSLPLLGAGKSAPGGGSTPTVANLDLNFAANLSLTPTVGPTPSFTRASTATSFNSTGVLTSAAINAPRFDYVYNGTSWVSKGLLVEEQRTNVCPRSQYPATGWQIFPSGSLNFTANFATAPDGTTTAARIYPNANGNFPTIYQNTTTANNCTSVYAKYNGKAWLAFYNTGGSGPAIWFNIQTGTVGTSTGYTASIQNVGNGWYRCSAVPNTGTWAYHYVCLVDADGGTTVTASGTNGALIWGAQAETGTFPTSYIPTPSTTAVTRSADVCQITGTNFSSFWNASEGSFACEVNPLGGNTIANQGIVTANDGTFSNVMGQIRNLQNTNGDYGAFCRSSGTTNMSISRPAGSTQSGLTFRVATGFKANDCADSLNGGAVITDGTVTLPNVDRLTIGDFHTGANTILNGHIARLRYYPSRLPDATLQLLSELDPSLNLQFAINKTLTPVSGPTPSFSRASSGTYFDASGVLRTAPLNLCTYSEQLNDASWNAPSNATISANAGVAPNGTTTADLLYPTANGANCYTGKAVGSVSLITHTNSFYLKAAGKSWATIYSIRGAFIAWFNLSNGTVGTTQTGVTATIQSAGNGWHRCTVARTTDFGTGYIFVGVSDADNAETITKNGTDGILVWGAQSEVGSSATDYNATVATVSSAPRFNHTFDGSAWISRGLLIEEQRTNLCTYSGNQLNAAWAVYNATVTSSSETDPAGGTNAFRVAETTTSDQRHIVYNTITPSASTFTYSVYAKAQERIWLQLVSYDAPNSYISWFNLSTGVVGTSTAGNTATITSVGNGWYRCSVTRTVASTVQQYFQTGPANGDNNAAYAGDPTKGLLVYGAQVEIGSFPTSYIPTTTAAVTRSADVCQITGTDFSGFYNATEGTVAVEYSLTSTNGNPNVNFLRIADAPPGNQSWETGIKLSTNSYFADVYNILSGGYQAQLSGTFTGSLTGKTAFAVKANDFAASFNGGAVTTDTSGVMPTNIGNIYIYANNNHIASLRYYPTRLTNAKLQELST